NKERRSVVAVRFSPNSDEIAVIGSGGASADNPDPPVSSKPAPEIMRVSSSPAVLRMMIELTSLSDGPMVEFMKAGKVVCRQAPNAIKGNRLFVNIPVKTIEALGNFDLRVTMADNTSSNLVPIDPTSLISDAFIHITEKVARTEPPIKSATVVSSVRSEVADGSLRVFVETDGAAKYNDFTLLDPSRVVLDVIDVRNGVRNKSISVDSAVAGRVRVGQPRPGVVRVVIDSKAKISYQVLQKGNSLIIVVKESAGSVPISVIRPQQ